MSAMNTSTENYRQTVGRLKQQLAASRFLRWWVGELSSMVPDSLRPTALGAESFAVVRLEHGRALLRRFDAGTLQKADIVLLQSLDAVAQRQSFLAALDKIQNGQRDVVIALASEQVLHKTLTLPLATEENLRQVLEFQMEEYTPFSLSQVYFGHRVAGREFARGQLTVDFAASPRATVDDAVKTLNDWGCAVRAVVVEDMLAAGTFVNLLPATQVKPRSILAQGLNPWLAALVLLLAMAAAVMPLVIKREAVVQMSPGLEKSKTAAEAAESLRRELEARVQEHNYLLEKRQAFPPVIVALEELTRVLPDDTWVQQLDIKGKELLIQGETASSVKLIGLFEQSGRFYDAGFRSPLTKGQTPGAERFQLALQIRSTPVNPVVVTLVPQPVTGIASNGTLPASSAASAAAGNPAYKISAPAAGQKP